MLPDDTILKDAFAAALLRQPNEPFRAALTVFGADNIKALECAQQWVSDTYVLSKQAELLEKLGEDSFLPNKAMLSRRVWEAAESATDKKEKAALFKLYAEVRGFVDKGGTNINTNVTLNQNRVMIMRDHGTDDDWERKASDQQLKLVSDARN